MGQPHLVSAELGHPVPDSFAGLAAALADRYRVERQLGAGGMATVLLAEDLRHQRKVAIKVLHPELAAALGADRVLAEITTTAALQHPGILPLFDSGSADGRVYYVMPFVRGESLRDRLDREHQLPVSDTVAIAVGVAGALDYAHGQGVVHRDIKPENILLQERHPLVADFGIALAITRAGGSRVTQTGLSLGTPQYMSPEQAAGDRTIDGRTDVYSLGAVCYEMLAGEPVFAAPTAQGVVGKLLSDPPRPLATLRKSVPRGVECAIHRALEKLPADRWNTPGEFAAALSSTATGAPTAPRIDRTRRTLLGGLALLGAALAGALVTRSMRSPSGQPAPATAPVRHFSILLPDSSPFSPTSDEFSAPKKGIAISPDGTLIAYAGRRGTGTVLHLVRLFDGSVTPLEGTEGARLPAFSPDGRWLGFVAQGEVRKVPVEGGTVVRVSPVEAPIGLFWQSDDQLLVSRSGIGPGTVPSSGGRVERLGSRFRASSFIHTQLLPGGAYYLGATAYGDLGTISLESGDLRFITIGTPEEQNRAEFGRALRGRNPHYLRSGYLVYASGSSLMSVPFDLRTLRATGRPISVAAGVRTEGGPGEAHFAVSDEETLVLVPGADPGNGTLVWVDQGGRITDTLPARSGNLQAFRLSRDGRRLALVERLPNTTAETRVVDLARRVEDRARLEGEFAVSSWTADGRALLGSFVADTARARACCFAGAELDVATLGLRPVTSEPHQILVEFDESPDGLLRCADALVGTTRSQRTTFDLSEALLLHRVDHSMPPRAIATARVPGDCKFSPDGQWVAYTTSDGLFVTSATLDSSTRTFKLVPGASTQLRWTADGRAILYSRGRGLFTVGIRATGDVVEPSEPRLLFHRDGLFTTWDVWGPGWDLGRDGRLLVWEGPAQPPAAQLRVITGLGALAAQKSGLPGVRE